MKKEKTLRSFLAVILAFVMLFGISSTAFASSASPRVSYVSLGDSMANGYGLAGYQPAEGNVNGYRQEAPDSYPSQVALANGWELEQLAISAMRVEDLNFILNFDWNNAEQRALVEESQSWSKADFIANKSRWNETFSCGDLYTWDEFVDGRFNDYAKVNSAESGTAEYAKMFQNSVADADYVSMGIGNANFGVFLLGRITNTFGVLGGSPAGDVWIEFQDALAKLDAPTKKAVMEVYNKLTAYLTNQNYIAPEQAELLANTVSYTVASYVLNYAEVIDRIVELNPDVNIVLVGLMNTMSGSKMDFWGNEVDLGDILDIVINSMNTYIAALPSAMKLTGNYADATFYYAEEPRVEMVVNTLSDAWNASWTGSGYEVIRERMVEDICGGMVFEAIAPLFDRQGITLNRYLNVAEIENYENNGPEAFLPDVNKIASCQVYLAFEEAIVESTQIEVMDAQAVFSLADPAKLNEVFGVIGGGVDPSNLQASLTDALVGNSTMKGLLNLYARHIIGNGIGSHPSAVGHDALTAAVLEALENEYTTNDKIVDTATEAYEDVKGFVLEYYDEAYAAAYEELDKNGYIDTTSGGIASAIEAIKAIDVSDAQMTDEFKAELAKELVAMVLTLSEIKAVLENDTAKDVEGLCIAVAGLENDLWLHLANAAAILEQAKIDIKTLVLPVVNAYVTSLMEAYKDVLQDITKDNVEAIVGGLEVEAAKLGHRHYKTDADSYYFAIGGDTLFGTGIGRNDKLYYELVDDALGLSGSGSVAMEGLLATEVVELVTSNAQNIASADLITYQLDGSMFVNALLSEEEIEWSNYIAPEVSELLNVILEEATEILTADWTVYANADADKVLETVLPQVQEAVAEYVTIDLDEAKIDLLIAQGISCVRAAINFVSAEKDGAYDKAVATIEGIDDMVIDYAEKLAYACVAYIMDTVKTVETIQTINPDATLLVVGMYNPLAGLEVAVNGKTIEAGEVFENVIDVTNAFYYTYAAVNGDFAFVDVSETTTNGFDTVVQAADMEGLIAVVPNLLRNIDKNMHANAEGHEYIKEQIVKTLTCDYSVYEAIDADYHAIKCAICGAVDKTEEHIFDGDVCTKCGYTKPETPTPDPDPTPNPVPGFGGGGGGVSASQFTIKFETNGGSKVESVVVKKGDRLEKPMDPIKNGYVFDGWYEDKDLTVKYDFSKEVKKSFTLYAKWAFKLNFTDLDVNAWYYDFVREAVEKGLMNGISETKFAPNGSLTRAMFVTILYRAAGEPGVTSLKSFADVPANQYYANAVAWASTNGIVNGVSFDKFAPDASITREQMAAIIYRFGTMTQINVESDNEINYTDADSIAPYAEEAAKWAYNAGVILGNTDGSFAPQRTATRAEAAAIFVRLLAVMQ